MERLAAFLQHRGLWSETLCLRLDLLECCVQTIGRVERNVTVLMCQHYVGMSLWRAGKYALALALQQHTHRHREAVLGPQHLDTIMSLSSIALILNRLGRHADAVDAHRRVLAGREAGLGRDHIMALYTRTNMAGALIGQGCFAAAHEMCDSTLAIMDGVVDAQGRCVYKADHPERLRCLVNRDSALFDTGRYADVVRAEEAILPLLRDALGPQHPFTLCGEFLRGKALGLLARFDDAHAAIADVLEARRRQLGERHADYIATLQAQAEVYRQRGELETALSLSERALGLCDAASLDATHERTLSSKQCIADALMDSRQPARLPRARALLADVLAQRGRVLRETHPALLVTERRMACLCMLEGDFASAVQQLARVTPVAEAALGPRHPDVLRCRVDLAVARRFAPVAAEPGAVPATVTWDESYEALALAHAALVESIGSEHPDCTRVAAALDRVRSDTPLLVVL
jgi:tetratricopeptide (TPR) repeat protein